MQIKQEYYTAETQDIPITVSVVAYMLSGKPKSYETILSLKVISDVIIRKYTDASFTSVRGHSASGVLGYTPIITTFGRGGALVGANVFQTILSSLGITRANWTYELPEYIPSTFLTGGRYLSSVSASPAGANAEITTTTSLYLAAPRVVIPVIEIDPNL